MQPRLPKNKEVRHLRMERKPSTQLAADDGQNWAVSYADMLMVLMSFFVIFFSFEGKQKESLLSKLSIEMQAKSSKAIVNASQSSENTVGEKGGSNGVARQQAGISSMGEQTSQQSTQQQAEKTDEIMNLISTELEKRLFTVSKEANIEQLTVHLSDQIYGLRQFALNPKLEKELNEVLEIVRPHKDKVRIIFIGHSDSLPLSAPDSHLANNLDLSSLRASRAISYATSQGFDVRYLSIAAAAENMRNSRSLSLKIVPNNSK
ncbi:MAG: flagellar motor protein MotB [Pseudomonadota bacterium]